LREAVHEAQVRQQHILLVLLEEERPAVDDVERDAVGKLDLLEVGLLGQDLVDVRGKERVGFEDRVADVPLDGGFELLFGRAGEALRRGGVCLAFFRGGVVLGGCSLFLEHGGFG
jgi:hypothetical protein